MKILLIILCLSIGAPTLAAEAGGQIRGEAFEKCLLETANTELNQVEQAAGKITREMIVPAANIAFEKCIPSALSETLSLGEVRDIRLRVLEYLDAYWINSRGT